MCFLIDERDWWEEVFCFNTWMCVFEFWKKIVSRSLVRARMQLFVSMHVYEGRTLRYIHTNQYSCKRQHAVPKIESSGRSSVEANYHSLRKRCLQDILTSVVVWKHASGAHFLWASICLIKNGRWGTWYTYAQIDIGLQRVNWRWSAF